MAQFCASNAGEVVGSVPDQGSNIPHDSQFGQKTIFLKESLNVEEEGRKGCVRSMKWEKRFNTDGFEAERGPQAKDCRQPLENGKDKKTNSPLEPSQKNTALLTPWF